MTKPLAVITVVLSIATLSAQSMIDIARVHGGTAKNHFSSMTPISTIEELAREATMILYGRVDAATTRLSRNERYVVTDLAVVPLRVYKGHVSAPTRPGWSKPVMVTRVGGTLAVEGLTLVTTYDDMPEKEILRVGEEAIFFLAPDEGESDRFVALGGSFGTMRVSARGVSPHTEKAANRPGTRSSPLRLSRRNSLRY